MRILIPTDPHLAADDYRFDASPWPARWIGHSSHVGQAPVVLAFRRKFSLEEAAPFRIHVTADERYEFWLDGRRIGRGSERGDARNWFYETYDLDVPAGQHVLVARVWWLGRNGPAPLAQTSVSPGFLLLGEGGLANATLSTGVVPWDVMELGGYSFVPPTATGFTGVGARTNIDGRAFCWGFETGGGDGWQPAIEVGIPRIKALSWDQDTRYLRPALLPAMRERRHAGGVARFVAELPSLEPVRGEPNGPIVHQSANLEAERVAWNALLSDGPSITIPPHTIRRVIVDFENYFCAYSDLTVTGGHGATVRTLWAESLFAPKPNGITNASQTSYDKANRDEIDGRAFIGMGSTFTLDGGKSRTYSPLWWDAGRYVAIDVQTLDEALTIESFTLRETGFPFEFTAQFAASDDRLAGVIPIALRTLQACAHETYMDCPYYEQLMYVGDTRLQALTTYVATADDRLPKKAVKLFDVSRDAEGFTASRYPTNMWQRIPTFSMWWVGMVHDHAHWRADAAFVKERMPGVRAVGEAVRKYLDLSTGLVHTPPGWNFVDWVPAWRGGVPPGGFHGYKGTVHWQAALMFRYAAELETIAGEPQLAARNTAAAERIVRALDEHFYDERRGLYAEDRERTHFSEHAQCLALIEGSIDENLQRRALLADGLLTQELYRTTIYFSHYLFEGYRLIGRPDRLIDRMQLWFGLAAGGFKTTPEMPEPTRSDCHAWGAHPVFHYFATLLGIRPNAPGFSQVSITPQLGPLEWATGEMPHPRGVIRADMRRDGDRLSGTIELPAGLDGELRLPGHRVTLRGGVNSF